MVIKTIIIISEKTWIRPQKLKCGLICQSYNWQSNLRRRILWKTQSQKKKASFLYLTTSTKHRRTNLCPCPRGASCKTSQWSGKFQRTAESSVLALRSQHWQICSKFQLVGENKRTQIPGRPK